MASHGEASNKSMREAAVQGGPSKEDTTLRRQSMEYVIRSGLAGGVAGCAAKTAIAPLDRVKILFQTDNPDFRRFAGKIIGLPRAMRQIVRAEGVVGLFRGHSATLLRVFPYAGIKFIAYEQFRGLLIRKPEHEVPWRRFMAGSASGVASVFVTYPLDVIRVQLAYNSSQYTGSHRFMHTVKTIMKQVPEYNKLGWLANFYSGFVPTILGMIPYAGVSFLVHDLVHDIFRSNYMRKIAVNYDLKQNQNGRQQLRNWAELTAGGISGMVAQTASYPLEIVRRRMQVAGIDNQRLSILQTFSMVYRTSGIHGFFIGLSVGYIKVIPMFAVSFFTYERVKYWFGI